MTSRGFLLIEVLIAILLLSLVGVSAARTFTLSLEVSERTFRFQDAGDFLSYFVFLAETGQKKELLSPGPKRRIQELLPEAREKLWYRITSAPLLLEAKADETSERPPEKASFEEVTLFLSQEKGKEVLQFKTILPVREEISTEDEK